MPGCARYPHAGLKNGCFFAALALPCAPLHKHIVCITRAMFHMAALKQVLAITVFLDGLIRHVQRAGGIRTETNEVTTPLQRR